MKRVMLFLLFLASPVWSGELVGPPAPLLAADKLLEVRNVRTRNVLVDVAWMGGAGALDVATTRYALRTCSECYEANPLFRAGDRSFQLTKAIVAKMAITGVATFACYELRKTGHRRAAKITRWTVVAIWVAAGFVNATHAQ